VGTATGCVILASKVRIRAAVGVSKAQKSEVGLQELPQGVEERWQQMFP